jgi:hypothetical protein
MTHDTSTAAELFINAIPSPLYKYALIFIHWRSIGPSDR